jgi:PAS domain S-box-containing protein
MTAASCVILVLLGMLAVEIHRELNELRSAPRDNLQWTLSQMEVDLLVLVDTIDAVDRSDEPVLPDIRRRFNTFYSRISTLQSGAFFRSLTEENLKSAISDLLPELDRWVPAIDGPDNALLDVLPRLEEDMRTLRAPIRAVSLATIPLLANQADERRQNLSNMMIEIAILASIFVIALVLALLMLFRMYRTSISQKNELTEIKERLGSTIDVSLDAIVVSDSDGRIVEYNPAAEKVFGFSRDQVLGQTLADVIIPPAFREKHKAGMRRYLETGQKKVLDQGRIQLSALHHDGHEFPIELSIGSATGADGDFFIGFARDISQQIADEEALTRARDEAMQADKAKSNFLAVMSHEMRTPLNGISGILEILDNTRLTKPQKELLDIARKSSEVLTSHIGDVLDIARVESGAFRIREEPFFPLSILQESVAIFSPQTEARGSTITLNTTIPADSRLSGDAARLRQVIINLVSNAVKFTRNGVITVQAELERSEDGNEVFLSFSVADTGIGIPESEHQRIFEDFVTLDPSYRRDTGGVGLGLGITRRIVQAMGGSMALESAPGKGSCFSISLPFAAMTSVPVDTVSDASPGEIRLDGYKALVIEDHPINALILSRMLADIGCTVDNADDGLQGIGKATETRYDFIFMDISMPGMDGLEATRRIRQDGLNTTTPIIGVTAHAGKTEKDAALKAGMNACLIKPFRRSELRSIVEEMQWDSHETTEDETFLEAEVITELCEILSVENVSRRLEELDDETKTGLAEISSLLANKETAAARKLAHRLTGAASAVGARSLAESMRRIEESAEICDPEERNLLLKSAENQRVSSFAALFEMLSNFQNSMEKAGL